MTSITPRRVLARLAAVGALALAASPLLLAGTASAHVTPQDPEAPSGGYFTTAFKVGHGCEGSPTTKVELQMADGVTSVAPQAVPGWTVSTTMRTLDPPLELRGSTITESVDTVVWEGGPLPDGQLEMFWVSMKLPEGEPGSTLMFPTVQTCEEGSTSWIEPVVEGEAEPELPAPVLTLTESGGHGHGTEDEADHAAGDETEEAATVVDGAPVASSDSGSSDGLAVAALVLGAIGALSGGVALVRSTRQA